MPRYFVARYFPRVIGCPAFVAYYTEQGEAFPPNYCIWIIPGALEAEEAFEAKVKAALAAV
jgi:hypothetical protein